MFFYIYISSFEKIHIFIITLITLEVITLVTVISALIPIFLIYITRKNSPLNKSVTILFALSMSLFMLFFEISMENAMYVNSVYENIEILDSGEDKIIKHSSIENVCRTPEGISYLEYDKDSEKETLRTINSDQKKIYIHFIPQEQEEYVNYCVCPIKIKYKEPIKKIGFWYPSVYYNMKQKHNMPPITIEEHISSYCKYKNFPKNQIINYNTLTQEDKKAILKDVPISLEALNKQEPYIEIYMHEN